VSGIARAASPDGPFSAIAFGIAPVDPDSVAMNTLDLDVDNNAANDHKTLGVSTEVRFGRLRLLNASGPPALALAVQIQTESWTGTGFQVNGLDGCTTLNRNNIVLESYAKNLNACETIVTATPVTFAGGVGSLRLTAPGVANDGSLTLKPQLGASASGNFCNTVGGSETATSAALKSYLQGNWTGANYDQNPFARASFGVYGAQPRNFIFYRENY
jgi:MSHA biogenesis protein MshQ